MVFSNDAAFAHVSHLFCLFYSVIVFRNLTTERVKQWQKQNIQTYHINRPCKLIIHFGIKIFISVKSCNF